MDEEADIKPGVEVGKNQDSQLESDNNQGNLQSNQVVDDDDKHQDYQDDEQQEDEDEEEEVDVRIKLEPHEGVNDNNVGHDSEVRIKTEPNDAIDEGNDDQDLDQDNNPDEEKADDEEDDDEDDHVKVTIDDDVPDYNLRAKQRQPQQAKPVAAIDLDAQQPILDIDINTIEDKPWRKPGADISDYFNYGFDEDTWKMYCEKQKKMKSIVNEVSCSTSETTFKIPVMPTNEHSKYSPARMIPTIVSNEPRFNAWIPPTIGSSGESDHQESNHNSDHRLVGDLDGGNIISIGGHGSHIGGGGGGAMLRGNMDMRDREMGRHMRSNDSHSLERIRDRDRKQDRDRDRDRDIISERDGRHRGSERDPSERLAGLSDRHGVVVDRFDRELEPRSDLRHRIDRLKEEREHVELDHHSSGGHQSSHRSHSGSRSEKHQHHGISSSTGEKHSSDRLDSSKHGSSSDRQKESSHRSEKSGRDRTGDKRSDREASGKSSSSSRNAERAHRSHRSDATGGSKKRDRSKERSKDRGEREKRRKRTHD